MVKNRMIYILLAGMIVFCHFSLSGEDAKTHEEYNNKICPVMGNEANPNIWVIHKGKKISLCCPGCIRRFKNNPEQYIKVLEEQKAEEDDIPN